MMYTDTTSLVQFRCKVRCQWQSRVRSLVLVVEEWVLDFLWQEKLPEILRGE